MLKVLMRALKSVEKLKHALSGIDEVETFEDTTHLTDSFAKENVNSIRKSLLSISFSNVKWKHTIHNKLKEIIITGVLRQWSYSLVSICHCYHFVVKFFSLSLEKTTYQETQTLRLKTGLEW